MSMFDLSIVLPVYNAEKYLDKCLFSIEMNLSERIELIIVNDGSNDRSAEIIASFSRGKENIRIINQSNHGLLYSRNEGVRISSGKYVYNMDSDDILSPDFSKAVLPIIDSHSPDLILFDAYRFFDGSKRRMSLSNNADDGLYDREKIRQGIIAHLLVTHDLLGNRDIITNIWSKVIKRDIALPLYEKIDKRINIAEDLCIGCAAIINADSLYVLHKKLYGYRTNKNSMMNSYKKEFFFRTMLASDYLNTIENAPDDFKDGICWERAFFAVSAFYNEFYFISSRSEDLKQNELSLIMDDEKLQKSLEQIDLNEVNFINRYILKRMKEKNMNALMRFGHLVERTRKILSPFIIT